MNIHVREGFTENNCCSFGICPNEGKGVGPAQIFGTFSQVHFWSIKGVYILQNAKNMLEGSRVMMDSLNINILKHFLRIFLSVPACSDRYKANPVETNSSRKGKNENF